MILQSSREKNSPSRAIYSLAWRDEIGVPHKIADFEGVLELNRRFVLFPEGK